MVKFHCSEFNLKKHKFIFHVLNLGRIKASFGVLFYCGPTYTLFYFRLIIIFVKSYVYFFTASLVGVVIRKEKNVKANSSYIMHKQLCS